MSFIEQLGKLGLQAVPFHAELGAALSCLALVLPMAKEKARKVLNKIPNPFSWRRF